MTQLLYDRSHSSIVEAENADCMQDLLCDLAGLCGGPTTLLWRLCGMFPDLPGI